MALEELNQQLYDPNSKEIAARVHSKDKFDPALNVGEPNPFEKEEQWGRYQKRMDGAKKKKTIIISVAVAGTVFLVGGFFLYGFMKSRAFFEDRVSLAFQGPAEADSTKPVLYRIVYRNDNKVTLKNVEIVFDYPENFQPTGENVNLKILNSTSSKFTLIGDIKPGSEGSVDLNGVFYAPKDFPAYLRATIKYVPSNKSQEFEMKKQFSVNIASSPVALDVLVSEAVSDGDMVEYVIDYKNPDTRALKDVKIKVDYPDGFDFLEASPIPSENDSSWLVGILDSEQGGKITIRGVQHGLENETKVLKVSLGYAGKNNNFIVFSQRERNIKIVNPLLSISQSVQGINGQDINAGENLVYVLKYQNNSDTGLRDAVVTAEIKGSILDFSRLAVDKGYFDSEKNLITWRAADVPGLANINPKQTGEVRFSVPVREKIIVQSADDKNFVVTSLAKIDSPDIPTPIESNKIIGSNRLALRLNSKVIFETKGFYKDENIQNTGPIPPVVGKPTTYVVHLAIASISNDLNDAKVVSSLPSGIEWVGQTYPSDEKITYNARTKELIWDVGTVKAGAGAIGPPREISFQVGIKPQINQVGQYFKLLNKATLTAKDAFTDKDINIVTPEKDSQLREDQSIGGDGYKIVAQ